MIAVKRFRNVAEMVAANPHDITTDAFVEGFWTPNDGGGGNFTYDPYAKSLANGGTIIAVTAWAGAWRRQSDTPIDVKWFGAKGDGEHDDTAAIQATMNAAEGGQIVIVGPGTYLVSSAITMGDAIALRGSGPSSILKANAAHINILEITSKYNIQISDLTFYGFGDDTATVPTDYSRHNCIKLSGCSAIKVINCQFTNYGEGGVICFDCTNCLVESNRFFDGVCSGRSQQGADIAFYALTTDSDNNRVINNNCQGRLEIGIWIFGETGTTTTNTLISGNTVKGQTKHGIAYYFHGTGDGCLITNNSVDGVTGTADQPATTRSYGNGIYLVNAHRAVVSNNQVRGCSLYSRDFTLGIAGICCNNSLDALIADNVVENNHHWGIYLVADLPASDLASIMRVKGNTITNNGSFYGTGSIANGSKTLSMVSSVGFSEGDTIVVKNAGSGGNDLMTTIETIVGTTFTLAAAAGADAVAQSVFQSLLHYGVWVNQISNAHVSGNLLTNNAGYKYTIAGLLIGGSEIGVTNGITSPYGCIIDGNRISDGEGNGVVLLACQHARVSHNSFYGIDQRAVYLTSGVYNFVQDNTFDTCGTGVYDEITGAPVYVTTGSLDIGVNTKLLTVADATGFSIGKSVVIQGAGPAAEALTTLIDNVAGTTITIHDAASTTVAGSSISVVPTGVATYSRFWNNNFVDCTNGINVTNNPSFVLPLLLRNYFVNVANPLVGVASYSESFFGGNPTTLPTVGGSTGANAALQDLCAKLELLGLISDATS